MQNLGKIEKELKRQEGWWEESRKFNRLERSMRLKRKVAREAESWKGKIAMLSSE